MTSKKEFEDNLFQFVKASNQIEGIFREPLQSEIDAHNELLIKPELTVELVESFVWKTTKAPIRSRSGMDVRVGRHICPKGHPSIVITLQEILASVNRSINTPFENHLRYLHLHPFMVSNSRPFCFYNRIGSDECY